ncbi:MAG: hypothetical protein JWQ27_2210 [Ferruginibacter sp.]|nr:hypothetical protein [Ferruginibacter sp.]
MKKVLFLLSVSVAYNSILQAQNTGIGTQAPYAKLTVLGNSVSAADKSMAILNSNNDSLLTVANNGNVGIGTSNATEKLQINNGFLKVGGAVNNKTAFTVTATPSNSSGAYLNLSYVNQSQKDMIFITHNYNPPASPLAYCNVPTGIWWNGSIWIIYTENLSPIANMSFNVLVIKQ